MAKLLLSIKSSHGHRIYRIKCNSGDLGSAYTDTNNYWKDGSGSNYGNKYRGMSLGEFARDVCGGSALLKCSRALSFENIVN